MNDITVGWKWGRFNLRGEQPNDSRLLMNEYNNLSEKFELGYVIRKDPAAL